MIREALVTDFARWVASCAVGPDAPVVSQEDIYRALDAVDFAPLFDRRMGRMGLGEFGAWHRSAVAGMREASPALNVGWAAKVLNEYLKTKCYVGGYGRDGLAEVIHPPIDDGLTRGLREAFGSDARLKAQLDSLAPMGNMDTYDEYEALIRVCGQIAGIANCSLLESEQFWD